MDKPMSPRRYVMENRARTAEDTRRRIVEATYALHAERAIGDTTMKDIAERADVGLGTVYHHFQTYNDAVRACGVHTLAVSAPPDATIFNGAKSLDERIARLAAELFSFYERCPGIAKARADQHKFEALKYFVDRWHEAFASLISEALRPAENASAFAPLLTALLDFDVHARLIAAGFSTASAADLIAAMLIDCVRKGQGGTQPVTRPRRNR
jgi:AcrR family transcriptional regulator